MYQHQPKRNNKTVPILLLIFALIAVALLFASVILKKWVGLLQLGAVIALVCEVALFLRYFRRSYVYVIRQTKDSAPDLVINELNGNECVTVCRLSLDSLLDIKKRSSSKKTSGKIYNYCADIAPANAYVLYFEECGEKYSIIMTPDEKMLSIFYAYLEESEFK